MEIEDVELALKILISSMNKGFQHFHYKSTNKKNLECVIDDLLFIFVLVQNRRCKKFIHNNVNMFFSLHVMIIIYIPN